MKRRVGIYTISKNEEKFVSRFMKSIKDEADVVLVVDTGSTDNTVESLRDEGAIVHSIALNPWRFDIPRNISLQLLPADIDICVCIDLDEVLTDGWRDAIEQTWTPQTTRLRYQYTWSTLADGSPGVTFWYDKIHTRNNYRWVKPVHETLRCYTTEVQTFCHGFKLFHYPDPIKSRGSYLPLLEQGCREEPDDDRNCHYLGREYMFYRQWDKSIAELQRHLALPNARWDAERSASMRYIARCFTAKNELVTAQSWALKACAEAPMEREPWMELAKIYYSNHNWAGLYYATKQALSIKERPLSYICDPESWGAMPHDLLSLAAFNLKIYQEAVTECELAIKISPADERLKTNLRVMNVYVN